MGGIKRFAELQESKREIVREIALKAGCFGYCKNHFVYYNNEENIPNAFKIATAMYNRKDPLIKDFSNIQEIKLFLKTEIDNTYNDCEDCEDELAIIIGD